MTGRKKSDPYGALLNGWLYFQHVLRGLRCSFKSVILSPLTKSEQKEIQWNAHLRSFDALIT